jgi:hypothetical protein
VVSANDAKGCLKQKWVWIVAALLAAGLVAVVVLAVVIVLGVFGVMRSSDVYREALTRAQASDAVRRELGEPIEPGWYVMGNIDVNNDSGRADLQIPVSGPKGSGTVEATATKRNGVWIYSRLGVELESGKWLDLSKGGP